MDQNLNDELWNKKAKELEIKREINYDVREEQLRVGEKHAPVQAAPQDVQAEPLPQNAEVELPKTVLPRKLSETLAPILVWKNLKEESSQPVVDAAKALVGAKTEAESAQAYKTLMEKTLRYMQLRAGWRKTRGGERRKKDIRAFLVESATFLANAGGAYFTAMAETMQAFDDNRKYERSFSENLRGKLNEKFGDENVQNAVQRAQELDRAKKERIRAWGGMEAEATRRLALRANPGTGWNYNIARQQGQLNVEDFRNRMRELILPEITSMSDYELLAAAGLEDLKKDVYLPMTINFNRLIAKGDLSSPDEILIYKTRLSALQKSIELYDARLSVIAKELPEKELKKHPLYGKYTDEMEEESRRLLSEEAEERRAESRNYWRERHPGRKPKAAELAESFLRQEKNRAS